MSAEQFADAVSQVIAPMYYAVAYDPTGNELSSNRVWHRELKFDRDVLPEPGKRYFRHSFSLPAKELSAADVLISVDHSYILYINGKNVSHGSNWRKVDRVNIKEYLKAGKNLIAVEGSNEGEIANPAGILFALKLDYADGTVKIIQSNENWKSTDNMMDENWTSLDFNDTAWEKVRNFGSSQWDQLVNFTFEEDRPEFARASLVRQHDFMKALGRPSRENVTTTRDEQATLLQALELTNGEYFNEVLAEGSNLWLARFSHDSEKIVETLYHKSFGRNPTEKEKEIAMNTLGDNVDKESLQDLFWTTVLLPEFQFIY